MGQNFKLLDRRKTSALLYLRQDKLETLSDTKYPLSLSFNNYVVFQIGWSDAFSDLF